MMKRDRTIDILKGIGILLVVYAHAIAGRICFVKYIFSFHMGLFFFAAGYLLKGKTDMPFGKFLLKKFKAFFVPYIVFFLFAMLVAFVRGRIEFGTFREFLWCFLISPGTKFGAFKWAIPLWFLHHLFLAELIFYFVAKCGKWVMGLVALCCMLFVAPYQSLFPHFAAPFTATALLSSVFYLCVGYLFRDISKYFVGKKYLAVLLIFCGYVFSRYNAWNMQVFTHTTSLYLLCSLFSIIGWYAAAETLGSRFLEYLGRNTLYIYGFHTGVWYIVNLLFIALSGIGVRSGPRWPETAFMWAAANVLISILCGEIYKFAASRLGKKKNA